MAVSLGSVHMASFSRVLHIEIHVKTACIARPFVFNRNTHFSSHCEQRHIFLDGVQIRIVEKEGSQDAMNGANPRPKT